MAGGDTAAPDGSEDQLVMVTLNLGWQMAEIYALVLPDQLEPPDQAAGDTAAVTPPQAPSATPRGQLDKDLPGASRLTPHQQLELMFDQVDVWVRQIGPRLTIAGLAVPDNAEWRDLSLRRHSAEGRYQLAAAILQFHGDMFTRLTAADYRLGRAYGLGRALADLSLRPEAVSRESFTDDLRSGRVQTINSWLGELHTVLPDHATGAVVGSIAHWQAWAAHPKWAGGPLRWPDHGASVVAMLRGQGKRWRSVLTGQVRPLDELAPEDYVDAADYLLGRVRHILQRLLAQYWPAVLLGILIMVAAVLAAIFAFETPVAKSAGAAVSFLAWLGITGKFVSAGLQRAVSQAENSLWACELDLAVARAITLLPGAGDIALGEPAPTLPRAAKAIGLGKLTEMAKPQAAANSGTASSGGGVSPGAGVPAGGTGPPGTAPPGDAAPEPAGQQ